MVVCQDPDLFDVMLSVRSHGWARDFDKSKVRDLQNQYQIDDMRNLYTFYHSGFNLRSTDLQAFLGISQIKKLANIAEIRERNFFHYRKQLSQFYSQDPNCRTLSSFAFGTLVENRLEVFHALKKCNIESRPLICGNIGLHPFWIKQYGATSLNKADIVHEKGIYLPNHHNLSLEEIDFVCEIFRKVAQPSDSLR